MCVGAGGGRPWQRAGGGLRGTHDSGSRRDAPHLRVRRAAARRLPPLPAGDDGGRGGSSEGDVGAQHLHRGLPDVLVRRRVGYCSEVYVQG